MLLCKPHIFLGWCRPILFFISNFINLSQWISKNNKTDILNDFFTLKRDYSKRYKLYDYIINRMSLSDAPIDYIEFGVFSGNSIKWWAQHVSHVDTRFYGFDTFEGLPENWGVSYQKGDMQSTMPNIGDNRVMLIKGLFQDTLHPFLKKGYIGDRKKIIHFDADLFSSTLYTLTSIAPYLNPGDILIFDEFNVPNHEFLAFKIFTESYYIKTKVIGAVNNFYQVAFVIDNQ